VQGISIVKRPSISTAFLLLLACPFFAASASARPNGAGAMRGSTVRSEGGMRSIVAAPGVTATSVAAPAPRAATSPSAAQPAGGSGLGHGPAVFRTYAGFRCYPPGFLPVGGFLPAEPVIGPQSGAYFSEMRQRFEAPATSQDMADLILDEDQTIALLANPLFTEDNRRDLEDEIVDAEMASLPMLLTHFTDRRPFAGGGLIADEAQYLFFRIVTGEYRSPHAPQGVHAQRSIFTIKDLDAWWRKNRARPIEEIQGDMARVVDRYWLSGQKTQEL
jgi:hypothetical protein